MLVKASAAEPLCAVMRIDHPLATLPKVTMRQTLKFPLGIPLTRGGSGAMLDAALAADGLRLTPVLESNSIDLLRRFALGGDGITFMPQLMVAGEGPDTRLAVVPVADAAMGQGCIEILTRRGRALPLAAEEFVDYLIRLLPGTGAAKMPKRHRVAPEIGAFRREGAHGVVRPSSDPN